MVIFSFVIKKWMRCCCFAICALKNRRKTTNITKKHKKQKQTFIEKEDNLAANENENECVWVFVYGILGNGLCVKGSW